MNGRRPYIGKNRKEIKEAVLAKQVLVSKKNLEDNELQSKLHPVTMKITEPKTPYTPYEEGDDEYFNKLNEVNKAKPTEDVLAQVINTLEKIPENKEEELGDTLPMGSKNKPKIDLNREVKQFKIILLGEKGVGKSSIIERYVNNKFSSNESLEGNDAVKIKRYDVDKNLTAELSINDTTEVEKLDKFPKTYYKDAHGAILVFNLTDQNSFEKLSYWKEELDSHAPSDIVICYLGNQADKIADRKVKKEDIKKILNEEDKLYYDVSAKTGNNISLAFEQLTMAIIEKQKEEQNNPDKVLRGKEGRKTLDLRDAPPEDDIRKKIFVENIIKRN